MKQLRKRFLAIMMCLTMVVSVFSQAGAVYAAEEATEYQIYPIPHEVSYQDGNYSIGSKVNVVFESKIDDVTKNRMNDVLAIKEITADVTTTKKDGVTNILVGVYGSGKYVDTYVKENYTSIDNTVFDEYSGHYVISNKNEIIVLGADTDAAFYGLTSLKHIFNQMEGSEIRNFTIKDYADTNIRGFIEGYYGIPWSNEDRMSLMEFGGEFKMTSYVFAPKNDPYHREKWRVEYPEEELEAIKEMVEVGNNAKCRFVWTAHPFLGGFNSNDVDGEIQALLNKFEQLYTAGVRQFGVLADDAGSINYNTLIKIMTAVSRWAIEKGDVYDSVFCPAGYNHSWQGSYAELNALDAGFPDDVKIFWTGEAVCKPVEQKTLDHFRRYNATNGERRSPLFWLNWPVNDINGKRLLMGKGSQLKTDINPDDLAGVITNPMQEAEASKVAIFAVADYSWNVKDFNEDQSWADSFPYIDADAAEELHTLAKHMSNPQPNGHGLILAESEELQPLITEFKANLASGKSIAETGAQLAAEMDVIIEACTAFHEKSKNENLKDEILPFSGSLKDLATAIREYTLSAMALENDQQMEAFEHFVSGAEAMKASENHVRVGLDTNYLVAPGSTHLIPLAETIEEAIADEINAFALGGELPVQLSASSSFDSFYAGEVANIIDGDVKTHAWYGGYEAVGQYYQVNLSQPSTVYGIDILNGSAQSGKGQDTFKNAKLQYTTDGTEWIDVPNGETASEYPESVTVEGLKLENVLAVRYICTVAGSKWPSMREFTLQLTDGSENVSTAYTNTEDCAEVEAVIGTDTHKLAATEYVVLASGEYIGLKLDRIHEVSNLDIVTTTDALKLQVSLNGVEWTDVEAGAVSADARYIRLFNDTKNPVTFDIEKFVVSTVEAEEKAIESTNYTSLSGELYQLFDGDWTTACQFANSQNAGKYIVIDLGSTITLNSFKAVCTDSEWDYVRHGKISVSADNQNWTEILTFGNQDGPNEGEAENTDEITGVLPDHEISYNTKSVTDLDLETRYIKFEVTRTKVGADKWVRFQEFELNGGAYIPTVNDPTVEGQGETGTNQYNYATDRSLFTSYTWNGDLVYHVSEAADTVKIIQNGTSNAVVSVRLAGSDKYVKLGTLSQAINVFTANGTILDVKITTVKDTSCSLTEIILSNSGEDHPDVPADEAEVVRLSGKSRYETGIQVAEELKEVLGVDKFESAVIATGKNFADALSGSYLASVKNAPILLTNGNPSDVAELHAYIRESVEPGATIYILGGEGAVPKNVEDIQGFVVKRLEGKSRYETNLAILKEAGLKGDDLLVATGKSFADSLSASAAARPILLVKPDTALNDAQKAVAANFKNIYVIGGESAVSASAASEFEVYGTVKRLSGAGRYETSVAVAKEFFTAPEIVVLANGKNFPDGLCGGPLAAALNAPLVLTKDGGEAVAAAYVADNGVTSGYVLGGTGAIKDETVVNVFALESADEIH